MRSFSVPSKPAPYRRTNTTRLHAGDDGRHGAFHVDGDHLVVYDRENTSAWIRVESPAAVET